jgi:hypothetical protein
VPWLTKGKCCDMAQQRAKNDESGANWIVNWGKASLLLLIRRWRWADASQEFPACLALSFKMPNYPKVWTGALSCLAEEHLLTKESAHILVLRRKDVKNFLIESAHKQSWKRQECGGLHAQRKAHRATRGTVTVTTRP